MVDIFTRSSAALGIDTTDGEEDIEDSLEAARTGNDADRPNAALSTNAELFLNRLLTGTEGAAGFDVGCDAAL